MKNLRVLAGAVLFVSSMAVLPGQTPAVFPSLDVRAPIHPRPLNGGGVIHLGYELYITNLAPYPTTIDAVETRDAAAPRGIPVDSSLGLSPAGLDRWHRGPVVHVVNEMPLGNAIVHFK